MLNKPSVTIKRRRKEELPAPVRTRIPSAPASRGKMAGMTTTTEFDLGLIERYGGRGPRYTSYPTAVQFQPGFGEAEYRAEVQRSDAVAPEAPLSIYLHIPFCHSLCYYCGCSKIVTRNAARAEAYLALLMREIELQGRLFSAGRPVEQLHLGGGTPTYLDAAQLHRLMAALATHFTLRRDERREFSIEIDPRTVSPQDIALLAERGFNRISMGVQDFEVEVQQTVNRLQSPEETAGLIEAARAAGFGSVSLDLIYGLPLQTVEGFNRTLTRVLEMRPDRLAVYSYAHLPQMFRAQKLIHEDQLPAPAVKLEILRSTIERLTAAGYVYVGMDHFALADDELVKAQANGTLQRNFQGYSTHRNADLIALGITAIGQVGNCYAQNVKEIEPYRAALDQGRLPIARGLLMTADDRLRRAVIQEIMCQGRLDFAAVSRAFGIDFADYFAAELSELDRLAADGLIEGGASGFTVSPRGRLLLRVIAMVFDRYLAADRPRQAFSKII
jgi:oxygen-independent coproporphyrinogen-3 oxidase